ncbi:MAG: hypothetical protein ABI678_15700, partial [Kofleriaceae bacterium]
MNDWGLVLLAPRHGMQLFRVNQPRLQLLRSLMLAGLTGLNFWALVYLQLDVTGPGDFSLDRSFV